MKGIAEGIARPAEDVNLEDGVRGKRLSTIYLPRLKQSRASMAAFKNVHEKRNQRMRWIDASVRRTRTVRKRRILPEWETVATSRV